MRAAPLAAVLLVASAGLCSCASVAFERTSSTSGTFRSTGLSFTFLSWDVPQSALEIAYENASDAGQPNTVPTEQWVFPHLGPLDWLLEIISIRYAVVSGTWGHEEPSLSSDDGNLSSRGAP